MSYQKVVIDMVREKQNSIRLLLKLLRAGKPGLEAFQLSDQSGMWANQADDHFIKQTILKADSDTYDNKHTRPCLEFWLVGDDIAEVGAPATLLVFTNDIGLQTSGVADLWDLAISTKLTTKLGAWLKSLFGVCEAPIIISEGFRIRFRREVCQDTGDTFIVPEWADVPTDETIVSIINGYQKQPPNVTVLPILESKLHLVRAQLLQLCPEVMLFLSCIRELRVTDKTKEQTELDSTNLLRVTRSLEPLSVTEKSGVWEFSEVTLSDIECSGANVPQISTMSTYYIFQQSFLQGERQRVIRQQNVTLAFPKGDKKAKCGYVRGDVFWCLPTALRTGFPFIIHADFIPTETSESDKQWNAGILESIPAAFCTAFKLMVECSLEGGEETKAWKDSDFDEEYFSYDALKFLPCNEVQDAYSYSFDSSESSCMFDGDRKLSSLQPLEAITVHQLEKIRREIFLQLGKNSQIFRCCSRMGTSSVYMVSNWFAADSCFQMDSKFRSILQSAAISGHPAPSLVLHQIRGTQSQTAKLVIINQYLQSLYEHQLSALGVPHLTTAQYESFLMDSQWLLSLPDNIYLKVLSYFILDRNLLDQGSSRYVCVQNTFRLLKVMDKDGQAKLVTFAEARTGSHLFFNSSSTYSQARWLSTWMQEFGRWNHAKLRMMPPATSIALRFTGNTRLRARIKEHVSLTALSIQTYSRKLMKKLSVTRLAQQEAECRPGNLSSTDKSFPILVIQFLYSAIRNSFLPWRKTVVNLRNLSHVCIVGHGSWQQFCASRKVREEGRVLLPPKVNYYWDLHTLGRQDSESEDYPIVLANRYLEPQCSLVENIVTPFTGPFSLVEFLKQSFNAVKVNERTS